MSEIYQLKGEISEIARELLGNKYLSKRAQKVVEEIANGQKPESLFEKEDS